MRLTAIADTGKLDRVALLLRDATQAPNSQVLSSIINMLAIQQGRNHQHQGKCTPNVLPCRINHNGPVDASQRYWAPTKTEGRQPSISPQGHSLILLPTDDKTVAYFRGRKLQAKHVKVPEGYRGVVLSSTDRIVPKANPAQGAVEEEGEAEDVPEVGIMEEQSEFEEVMVWGHEALPDDMADPYVKGMEEWISLAGKVRGFRISQLSFFG